MALGLLLLPGCSQRSPWASFGPRDPVVALREATAGIDTASIEPEVRGAFRVWMLALRAADAGDTVLVLPDSPIPIPDPKGFLGRMMTADMFEAQELLAQMGYGTRFTGDCDEATAAAIREYETDRGLPVTSNPFTPATYARLRMDEDSMARPVAMVKKVVTFGNRWVHANGQLMTDRSDARNGVRGLDIECFRETMACRLATATEWLEVSSETYRVISWDDTELRAQLDFPCARYIITINRIQESLEEVRTTLSTAGSCVFMERETLRSTLEDGHELNAKRRSKIHWFRLSPKLREQYQMTGE